MSSVGAPLWGTKPRPLPETCFLALGVRAGTVTSVCGPCPHVIRKVILD